MTREGVDREALVADPYTGGNSENLGMYRGGGYFKPLHTTRDTNGRAQILSRHCVRKFRVVCFRFRLCPPPSTTFDFLARGAPTAPA